MHRRTFLNASLGLALPSVLATALPANAADRTGAVRRPQRKRVLKSLIPGMLVTAILRRGDRYYVATADRAVKELREFDVRFKTDSTAEGPDPGKPAILHPTSAGDRATIVFASAEEISAFIQVKCE